MISKDNIAHNIAASNTIPRIHWRVPTSIFIGIAPLKFANYQKDEKGEFVSVKVFNPAEHRWQSEKLRIGKATGIVLRGGRSFGWASQPLKPDARPDDFMRTLKVKEWGDAISKLKRAARSERNEKSSIEPSHMAQLTKCTIGSRVQKAIARLSKSLVRAGVVKSKLVARMYGGASYRTVSTFGKLYDTLGIDAVPEMWGNGVTSISPKTRDLLVGFETKPDGSITYIRLARADVPKSATIL